jgi:hypothetical protein
MDMGLYIKHERGNNRAMGNRAENFTAVGAGAFAGILVVATAGGALSPIGSFFLDGLLQYLVSMQWARFSCF